jgi:hypothetical protein
MKRILIAVALLAAATGSFAQNPVIGNDKPTQAQIATTSKYEKQVDKLIDQKDVERIIKTLADDDMQGRGIFTPGIDKAATFIEGEFKKAGLVPMHGDTKGFRQEWELATVAPISSSVTINGKAVPADSIKITTSAAAINWNNNKDVQVVYLSADKDYAKETATYAKSGKKLLIITDHKFAANLTGGRRGGGRGMKVNDDQVLAYVIGNFGEVKSFTVNYSANVTRKPLFNVAGMIPGKSKNGEYVVFSGHYDHLGILKGNKVMAGDSIANGADDDASGTTAVITLAKYFKKLDNNERTLIFIAFTGEESGDLGSGHFGETADPSKAVAMFNIEMIGLASKWGQNSAYITGFERSDFGAILQRNLAGTAFQFHPDPYPTERLFTRSDNWALAQYGVAAHTISTVQMIPTDIYYHTVKDEYSTLDVSNITATIKAIALSSRTIISGQDTPTKITDLSRN